MKYNLTFLILLAFIFGCNQKPGHHLTKEQRVARMDSLKNDLLKADIAFSQLSEQKGRNAAFIEYADSQATMLRVFNMPIHGRDSIINLMAAHPDSTIVLTWIPIYADVAHSGDLGYTYGTYSVAIKGEDKTGGTYCMVWRKDNSGQWKFILGTGNQGLKPEEKKD